MIPVTIAIDILGQNAGIRGIGAFIIHENEWFELSVVTNNVRLKLGAISQIQVYVNSYQSNTRDILPDKSRKHTQNDRMREIVPRGRVREGIEEPLRKRLDIRAQAMHQFIGQG